MRIGIIKTGKRIYQNSLQAITCTSFEYCHIITSHLGFAALGRAPVATDWRILLAFQREAMADLPDNGALRSASRTLRINQSKDSRHGVSGHIGLGTMLAGASATIARREEVRCFGCLFSPRIPSLALRIRESQVCRDQFEPRKSAGKPQGSLIFRNRTLCVGNVSILQGQSVKTIQGRFCSCPHS